MGRNQPAAKGPSTARSQAHCSTPALQGFRKLPFRPLLVPFLDARAKGPRTTGRSGSAPGSGVPRRCRHTDLPRRPGKPHGRTPLPPPRTAVRHKTRRSPPGLPAGGGTAPRDEASPSAHGPCPARTRTHTHTHTRVRAQSDALRTRTLRNPAAFPAPPREGPPQPYGRALRETAASAAPLTGTPKPPRAAPRAARCPRPCPARPALTCRATSAAAIAASPPQGPPRPAGRAAPDAPTAPPHGGEKPPRRSTPRAPPAP